MMNTVAQAIRVAGWSSLVARRAHNPKVVGSSPTPATIFYGGVAQLARAFGSYPEGHVFESHRRYQAPAFAGAFLFYPQKRTGAHPNAHYRSAHAKHAIYLSTTAPISKYNLLH